MKLFHDMPTAGHLGVEKTLEKVKESFYWPGMKDYIHDYCRQCDRCFSRKPKRQKNQAPLGSYLVGEPMERIAIDILGPCLSRKVETVSYWSLQIRSPNGQKQLSYQIRIAKL